MTINTKAWRIALAAGASLLAFGGGALAQTAGATPDAQARIEALEAQLEQLAGQIADLKAATAASLKDVRTVQSATTVSLPGGRPTFATVDGAFTAALRATVNFDVAQYLQDKPLPAAVTNGRDLNSGSNFRRARLAVEGKVFSDFDYNLVTEFGGSGAEDTGRLYEAWVQYSGFKPLRFRVGAFAPSIGLEDAGSTNGGPFLERPSAVEAGRSLAAGDSRTAAAVIGAGDHWFASAAVTGNLVSSFNSQATAFTPANTDEQLGYVFRAAATPLYGFDWLVHVGANASIVAQPGDLGSAAAIRYPLQVRDRPELRVDGTRLADSGAIDANGARTYGLELAAQKKNLFAQAEYVSIEIDRRLPAAGVSNPTFEGWYAEGSWILTGEQRRYNITTAAFDAPPVAKPFNPKRGQWGAWELAARYSTLNLNHDEYATLAADRVRGGQQNIWTLGVNWYLNPVVRLMLDYQDVSVDRLNAAGAQAGQDYQALAIRTQAAF